MTEAEYYRRENQRQLDDSERERIALVYKADCQAIAQVEACQYQENAADSGEEYDTDNWRECLIYAAEDIGEAEAEAMAFWIEYRADFTFTDQIDKLAAESRQAQKQAA
ncbi:hypothetical protein [Bergeriella denitrificans]|uniref:Uncharacterized protein n=1 Tax=Bergeriella denitrificans TaxID=494 RepID=A0A378UJB1_BERDE|nr:hypothetical protein [Bergeriella denitrificans]STZ77375.1 Uncharacterised protein [Bergeriella denitrificans]